MIEHENSWQDTQTKLRTDPPTCYQSKKTDLCHLHYLQDFKSHKAVTIMIFMTVETASLVLDVAFQMIFLLFQL